MKKFVCVILCIIMSLSLSAMATGSILTEEEGKAALAGELDMTLVYGKVKGENRAALVYIPEITPFEYFVVSAETGKRVEISINGARGGPAWPPEQSRKVDKGEAESNGLLTETEIAEIIKNMPETVFCDYSVDSISYVYSGRDEHGYFYKAVVNLSDGENSATVTLNAKNGNIEGFSSKLAEGEGEEQDAKKLLSVAGDFIGKRTGIPLEKLTAEMVSENSCNFSRTENKILYGRDRIYIDFDKNTGKISFMVKYWNPDIVFEDVSGVISEDAAKEVFVEFGKPELCWEKIADGTEIPVYMLTRDHLHDVGIGAKDGSKLSLGGEIYTPDIWGHWAEEKIMKLSELRVISWDGQFRPDKAISDEEAAEFLDVSLPASSGGAYAPTGMTRQYAVDYIMKTMEIDEEAENKDGKIKFSDEENISPEFYDSIALASNLGIISGYGDGTFRPRELITRAEFATIIYNILVK